MHGFLEKSTVFSGHFPQKEKGDRDPDQFPQKEKNQKIFWKFLEGKTNRSWTDERWPKNLLPPL